jgi:hypothetical protein
VWNHWLISSKFVFILVYMCTWLFYLKFNLSKIIYFLKCTRFLYVLSKYHGMFKLLQWNARLWKTPTLKIAPSSPGNSLITTHTSLSQIQHGFLPGFVNYKKGCTRLAAASDKVYHLLAHGGWFSPGTLASSTTKTGRHNIAEILLKVALNTKNQISNHKTSRW